LVESVSASLEQTNTKDPSICVTLKPSRAKIVQNISDALEYSCKKEVHLSLKL
jgi:hypothetical protein